MTLLLNAEIQITRNPDAGGQVMYGILGVAADPTLQYPGISVDYPYVIATPANPSLGIFATVAAAQADFIANQLPALVSAINSIYPSGPTYTGIGTVSIGGNSNAAVTISIGGSAIQAQNANANNLVILSLTEAQTISLTTGQTGTLSFMTSPTSGGTYTMFSQIGNANSGALTLGLGLTNSGTSCLVGFVPMGYYYKVVASGTGTNTFVAGQEITL